jgi:hypothetical protein
MSHDARFGATAVARVGLRAPGPVRLGQHTLRAASLVLRARWVVSAGAQLAPAADEERKRCAESTARPQRHELQERVASRPNNPLRRRTDVPLVRRWLGWVILLIKQTPF